MLSYYYLLTPLLTQSGRSKDNIREPLQEHFVRAFVKCDGILFIDEYLAVVVLCNPKRENGVLQET